MRTIEQMVQTEVLCCMSSMVATVAQGFGQLDSSTAELSDLAEQAFELARPIEDYEDYEEAAREAGWTCKGTVADRAMIFANGDAAQHHETWAALCEAEDIEPHEREVYEHWAVSSWFAEKLQAAGERVDMDFAGLCVWARTTTGQAIYADGVVERIYAETHKAAASIL